MSTTLPVCKYQIEYRALKALALLASKDATRYVLNGVAIESRDREVFVVAVDGRRLGVMRYLATEDGTPNEETLIIPHDLIKRIPKPIISDCVTVESNCARITITSDDSNITGNGIVGNFPSWRQVIPTKGTHAPKRIDFNPELLKDFFAIAKIITKNDPAVTMEQATTQENEASGPFIIRVPKNPDFLGVLMPLREGVDGDMVQEWAKAKEVTSA